MRIDPQEYYAVAAVSHDVSLKVGALARERIGGLQSIAAEPPTPRVIVVGHRWDTACGDLRRFLARNQISLNWVTPDSPELSTVWPGARPADGDLPVLRLADGRVLARPEVRDLANRLGLQTSARADTYSVAIIGGEPPALRRLSTARRRDCARSSSSERRPVDRQGRPRGSRTTSDFPTESRATSWPVVRSSRRDASGQRSWSRAPSLASIRRRAKCFSTVATSSAHDTEPRHRRHVASARRGRPRPAHRQGRLLWGRAQRSGRHARTRHPPRRRGNSAGQAALDCSNHARRVTLVVRGSPSATPCRTTWSKLQRTSNVEIRLRSEVHAVHGDTHVTGIDIRDSDTREVRRHDCGGLFIFIGADAETEWLPPNIVRDGRGYVLTGEDVKKAGHWSHRRDPYLLETSVPGVFACGTCG